MTLKTVRIPDFILSGFLRFPDFGCLDFGSSLYLYLGVMQGVTPFLPLLRRYVIYEEKPLKLFIRMSFRKLCLVLSLKNCKFAQTSVARLSQKNSQLKAGLRAQQLSAIFKKLTLEVIVFSKYNLRLEHQMSTNEKFHFYLLFRSFLLLKRKS